MRGKGGVTTWEASEDQSRKSGVNTSPSFCGGLFWFLRCLPLLYMMPGTLLVRLSSMWDDAKA